MIGFAEEEGVRFSAPYIGSSAIAGRFNAALLQRSDSNGVSLGAVLQEHSVDLTTIERLARQPQTLRGYLEVHIEQGPQLLERDLPVGIVTSIAGVARFRIAVQGVAGSCRHRADGAPSRRCRGRCGNRSGRRAALRRGCRTWSALSVSLKCRTA